MFSNVPRDLHIGGVDPSDELGSLLHTTAVIGTENKLKRVLSKGIDVDYPNDMGQTPLFCACVACNENNASLLLEYGADPNLDNTGVTPLLVACYIGRIGLLCKMIEAGGDVCILDNNEKGILDWADKNTDLEARNEMVAFLQQTRIYGLLSSAFDKDEYCDSKIPIFPSRPLERTSVMELVRKSTGSDISLESEESTGRGQVYPCVKESSAIVSVIPLISEVMLKNIKNIQFECSLDFTMREMFWFTTEVSVKTLKSDFEIKERADLIISEATFLSKLHHPNVIMLMALCQPNTLDMITLVFERVDCKNLYQYFYLDNKKLTTNQCSSMATQLCSAMGYIHNQGYIHCGLSSMAVYLTSSFTVKLGNFEFMIESYQAEKGSLSSLNCQKNISSLYFWMAPEMIRGSPPDYSCDVFSFCCILWEMFNAEVPWSWLSTDVIYDKAFLEEKLEPLPMARVSNNIRRIIEMFHAKRESNEDEFRYIYTFLTGSKGILNFSYNSLSDDSPLTSPCKNSDKRKIPSQDKLIFSSSRNLQTQGRSFNSTSAITTKADAKKGFEKNSSEGDLLFKGPSVSHAAIKPASHLHQPAFVFKTHPNFHEANIRPEGKNTSISSLNSLTEDDDDEIIEKQKITGVRQLAEGYQQKILQHKLRQAILKGSMAPQGTCQDGNSPLDHSRWCSLPSTIKELSRSWSYREDSGKIYSSDIGNLSCTPKVKQTSTPLRRNKESNNSPSVALFDFFRQQRTLRNVGTCCKLDEGDMIKPNRDVVEEMKIIQTQWKRRVIDDEDRSSLGVSYHSPVLEFHKKKSSIVDSWHDKSFQTGDGLVDHVDPGHKNETPEHEQKHNEQSDSFNHGDGVLKKYNISPETEMRDKSVIVEERSGALLDGKVPILSGKTAESNDNKDSFWDLTQSTWPKNRSVEDDVRGSDKALCGEKNMEKPSHTSLGKLVDDRVLIKNDSSFDIDKGTRDENVRCLVNEKTERADTMNADEGSEVKNTTFCIQAESDYERADLNTTFTIPDTTEPDSLFPDSLSHDGVSHWLSNQLDMIKHQMMTNDYINKDEIGSLDSSESEEKLHDSPSYSLLKIDSDIQEAAKNFEFEFQEFYIDDDFDTCEKIHDEDLDSYENIPTVMLDKSREILDSNSCTRTTPEDSLPPPLTLSTNRLVTLNKTFDCEENEFKTGQWNGTGAQKKSHSFSGPTVTEEGVNVVKDRIDLYERSFSERKLPFFSDQVEFPSSKIVDDKKQNKYPNQMKPFIDRKKSVGNQSEVNEHEEEMKEMTKAKNRLIPKMIEKDKEVTQISQGNEETERDGNLNEIKPDKIEAEHLIQSKALPSFQNEEFNTNEENLDAFNDFEDGSKNKSDTDMKTNVIRYNKGACREYLYSRLYRPLMKCCDTHDCDSNEWLRERLQNIQGKIKRRRQRRVYTYSSDEEDWNEEEFNFPSESMEKLHSMGDDPCKMWSTDQILQGGDVSLSSSYSEEADKQKKLKNMSGTDCCSANTRHSYLSNENNLPRMIEDYNYNQLYPTETSDPFYVSDEEDSRHSDRMDNRQLSSEHIIDSKRKEKNRIDKTTFPQRAYKSLECVGERYDSHRKTIRSKMSNIPNENDRVKADAKRTPVPKPRSHGSIRGNESRSSIKTVVFEDETDRSREFSSRNFFIGNVSSAPNLRSARDQEKQQSYINTHAVIDGSIRGNESRSSIKTVVFEDETDRSREFSPRNCFIGNVSSAPNLRSARDQERQQSYISTHAVIDDSVENEQSVFSKPVIDTTFDVVDGDKLQSNDRSRREENNFDPFVGKLLEDKSQRSCQRHRLSGKDEHCIALSLQHMGCQDNAAHSMSRKKICTVGDSVYTEVHRFYIPLKEGKWSDGCKARLDVKSCPNKSDMQEITTTAINPITGQSEILMEKTVETNRMISRLELE